MPARARKICLPEYVVTEVSEDGDVESTEINLPNGASYFIRPKLMPEKFDRQRSQFKLDPCIFHTYPIVMQGDGAPWDEANLFIFKKLGNSYAPNMTTVAGIAEDLAAYRRFLESSGIDWQVFPVHKNTKPTYRYRSHLTHEVWAGKLKPSTAKRRMGVIIRFYRWLMDVNLYIPEHSPWKDEDRLISIRRGYGQPGIIKVHSTDLRITVQTQDDPYDGCIDDGGKLRPLL